MFLLAEVLLVGVLLLGVPLVAEEGMVLVVSKLLEKRETIPPESVTLEGEKVFCSLTLRLCSGTLGTFSLRLTGLGGIDNRASGFCRCASMLVQQ